MAPIFNPSANLAAKLGFAGGVVLVLAGIGWWWGYPRTDYRRQSFWYVNQLVPFSHKHHVNGLGIDCRFCHVSVEVSTNAGMPPTYTCMTCHSQVWTNALMLQPVRDSLAKDTPMVWRRIYDIPDYVFFDHGIHIAKGVGCAECHGEVNEMPLTYKATSMTMTFCIDCHIDPGPRLRPKDQIFNMQWKHDALTPPPKQLLTEYHVPSRNLLDCSICHR